MSLEIRLQHAIADRRLMTYQPGKFFRQSIRFYCKPMSCWAFRHPKTATWEY